MTPVRHWSEWQHASAAVAWNDHLVSARRTRVLSTSIGSPHVRLRDCCLPGPKWTTGSAVVSIDDSERDLTPDCLRFSIAVGRFATWRSRRAKTLANSRKVRTIFGTVRDRSLCETPCKMATFRR